MDNTSDRFVPFPVLSTNFEPITDGLCIGTEQDNNTHNQQPHPKTHGIRSKDAFNNITSFKDNDIPNSLQYPVTQSKKGTDPY